MSSPTPMKKRKVRKKTMKKKSDSESESDLLDTLDSTANNLMILQRVGKYYDVQGHSCYANHVM